MRLADMVYGPARNWSGIRPTVVDMDTVRDLVSKAQDFIDGLDDPTNGPATVIFQRHPTYPASVEAVASDGLEALSAHDRNTLSVMVRRGHARTYIDFGKSAAGAIDVNLPDASNREAELKSALENIILDNGAPIWRPQLLKYLLPLVGALVFLALWVWLLASADLPLPGALLGWLITVGVATWAVRRSNHIRFRERSMAVSHRIRVETRAETYARRVDERANFKVALWAGLVTAVIALPSGFLLAVLTNAFGIAG